MTALTFRNVDASPDDPVSEWPLEAIQTALERGGLEHWRRLASELRADPWGPVTRCVEEVLSHSRPYGVAEAMERVIARSREEAETRERKGVATEIDALIRRSGFSRTEFASRIGTSTSRLSTYANGKVTPSAALLLRMRRVADKVHASKAASLRGVWRGRVKIADDFDKLPDDLAESPGLLVRDMRRLAGLSQRALAKRADTSQPAIARYERGAATPSWETLQRIAAACGREVRMSTAVKPDPRDVELANTLLQLTPQERLRSLRRYSRLRTIAEEQG